MQLWELTLREFGERAGRHILQRLKADLAAMGGPGTGFSKTRNLERQIAHLEWMIHRKDFSFAAEKHAAIVYDAIRAGHKVPRKVLRDYPQLVKEYGPFSGSRLSGSRSIRGTVHSFGAVDDWKLMASAGSLGYIAKAISEYYYGPKSLRQVSENEWVVVGAKGIHEHDRVILKKGRYRFEQK